MYEIEDIHPELFLRINNLPYLTKSEAKIIRYFKEHREQLALENIQSISQGVGASKATVTRFIQKLGYKDFAEFKASLRMDFYSKLHSPYQRHKAQQSELKGQTRDPWAATFDAAVGDMKQALDLNSNEKIMAAARTLNHAKGRLFVLGFLASYGIAHYFHSSLFFMKPSVLLDNHAGNLYQQLADVGAEDVLFAISYQGYVEYVTRAMQHFHNKRAKVVLLTDSQTAPPVKWADHYLLAPTRWESALISRCSCMMVVEGVLSAMVGMGEDSVQNRVDKLWNLADTFETFSVRSQKRLLSLPNSLPGNENARVQTCDKTEDPTK